MAFASKVRRLSLIKTWSGPNTFANPDGRALHEGRGELVPTTLSALTNCVGRSDPLAGPIHDVGWFGRQQMAGFAEKLFPLPHQGLVNCDHRRQARTDGLGQLSAQPVSLRLLLAEAIDDQNVGALRNSTTEGTSRSIQTVGVQGATARFRSARRIEPDTLAA